MKLNHINLVVPDVADACRFFETYFGFNIVETKGDNMIAVLKSTDGFVMVMMAASLNKKGPVSWPDAFHIGFLQDTKEQVHLLYDQLHAGGHASKAPQKIRDSFGFYFHYQDIMVEISASLNK